MTLIHTGCDADDDGRGGGMDGRGGGGMGIIGEEVSLSPSIGNAMMSLERSDRAIAAGEQEASMAISATRCLA